MALSMIAEIELTPEQIEFYAKWAKRRSFNARKVGKVPKYGQTLDRLADDELEGALSEAAVAKYLGYTLGPEPGGWESPILSGGDGGADVDDFGVRTTKYKGGCLILHPEDDDNRVFFLVTGERGKYIVRGSILARDGKRDLWWREDVRYPCYMVPQSALNGKPAFRMGGINPLPDESAHHQG